MSRQLFEEARKVLTQEAAVKLDPVGQEDKDVDNDGDADKTDSYLKKRRGAISAAIAKSKNESALSDEDLAKLKTILGEMKKKEEMEDEEEEGVEEKEMKKEEVEQVDEMQVANKYALKGPQPADVPAYMRKGNARKTFPVKLADLKRKDTMSDVENLRKIEEVESVEEGLAPGQASWKKEVTAKGAVSFKRDQHGGGAVDRIVAYDKDGKVVGGFNRKGVSEAKLNPAGKAAVKDVTKKIGAKTLSQTKAIVALAKLDPKKVKEEVEQVGEALKGEMHPDAAKVLKHIKPQFHSQYKPYLKVGTYKGNYADRAAILSAAERAGHAVEESKQEDFELIEKLNFEVPENPSYQDYFKAALKMAQVESFAELDEEDQQYIMNEMENAFRQNDTSFILEADMMGDMNDTVQRLRKAGHKVEDMGRDFKGNPFYVYIDKGSSMRRKVTYKGTQKVTQNMGKAQPEKEEE